MKCVDSDESFVSAPHTISPIPSPAAQTYLFLLGSCNAEAETRCVSLRLVTVDLHQFIDTKVCFRKVCAAPSCVFGCAVPNEIWLGGHCLLPCMVATCYEVEDHCLVGRDAV